MHDGGLRLDGIDRRLLAFAADHRVVLARQLERLVGCREGELDDRLAALTAGGYLRTGQTFGARHYQVKRLALAAIASELPVPGFSLAGYRHDVGLAWLWLAAHGGSFGRLREVLSERRLRSHDGVLEHPGQTYGIHRGDRDRFGNRQLHYPDLLLVDPHGRRLALELELSGKGQARRELILGAYGADPRIDRVLYLVEDDRVGRAIGRQIEGSARDMGLSALVYVQRLAPLPLGPWEAEDRSPGRGREPAQVALASHTGSGRSTRSGGSGRSPRTGTAEAAR